MAELSLTAIFKYLKEHGFSPERQPENDQIVITIMIKGHEVPIFFGIISEGTILQMIAYLPFILNEKALPEAARLLHFVNREVDLPGFGMDEKSKLMFYRLVLPSAEKQFDEKLLELYLGTTRILCETFMDGMALIASGTTRFDTPQK